MNVIELLTQQHLEVESLFDQFEGAAGRSGKARLRLCWKLGDLLAAHLEIEETIFYRATRRARTEELLDGALEEHRAMKRSVADLVEAAEVSEDVEATVAALRERKRRHAAMEEAALLPVARELYGSAWLEELGQRMEKMSDELMARARRARGKQQRPVRWRGPRGASTG
jgi:hypothetical protein